MPHAKTHVLDNPIWNALQTGNRPFAFGNKNAAFIRRDMGAFAGMPCYEPEAWSALHAAVEMGEIVVLFTPATLPVPAGWQVQLEKNLLQMVHTNTGAAAARSNNVVPLTEAHIPDMLALTQLTKPGPFLPRTIDFGNYEGIFENGQLVSMAGQRLQPDPYTELSAVCTHPDALGKGYAGMLIQSQVEHIGAAGRIPFLHVYPENEGAVALYRKLGFAVRRELVVYVLEKTEL